MSELLEMTPRPPMIWLVYHCAFFALVALIMFRWIIARWWALGLYFIAIAYVAAYVIKVRTGEEWIAAYCAGINPNDPIEQVAQRAIAMKLPVRRNEARQAQYLTTTSFHVEAADGAEAADGPARSICELEHDAQRVVRSRLQRAMGGGDEQLVSYCEETKPDEPVEQAVQRAIDRKLAVRRYEESRQNAGWRERSSPAYLTVGGDRWILSYCFVEHDGERTTKVNFSLWYQ